MFYLKEFLQSQLQGNYRVRKRLLHFLLEFIAVVHRFPHPLAVMLLREDNIQCDLLQSSKYCNQELLCGNLAFMENTQMWKEPESMIHRGKHPADCLYHLEVALHAETTTGTGFLQNYIESILALQDASCRLTQAMVLQISEAAL
nr:udp-sugar pyrophosphorylase [Quercus suber]